MSIRDAQITIVAMGKGNPGAIKVLSEVLQTHGEDVFSAVVQGLRVMKFEGPAVWVCYKDYAGQDLSRFVAMVRERNEDMQRLVNREIGR